MSEPRPDGDATMSVVKANLIALLWMPASGALVLGPFIAAWGSERLDAGIVRLLPLSVLLPVLAASVLVHEVLHVVGFLVFGRVPKAAVRIGFQRRTLTPYASCRVAVSASVYRGAALLPAIALGLVPAVLATAFGFGGLAAWATLMLALAGGDLASVWAIRRVAPTTLVLDHPARVGCTIVPVHR